MKHEASIHNKQASSQRQRPKGECMTVCRAKFGNNSFSCPFLVRRCYSEHSPTTTSCLMIFNLPILRMYLNKYTRTHCGCCCASLAALSLAQSPGTSRVTQPTKSTTEPNAVAPASTNHKSGYLLNRALRAYQTTPHRVLSAGPRIGLSRSHAPHTHAPNTAHPHEPHTRTVDSGQWTADMPAFPVSCSSRLVLPTLLTNCCCRRGV
ncbi:hypothetical protein B0J18DRAFT_76461 [Chaetomium sp. MPI-SDFR-AT-0129]|nr:hypothetical protein B0J18DRAFT_76461 [Chaetomium sp. MPI-SDFR-AT-0129]